MACSTLGVSDGAFAAMGSRVLADVPANLPRDFMELGPSYRAADPEGSSRWRDLHDRAVVAGAVLQPWSSRTVTEADLGAIQPRTLLIAGEADLYAPPPIMRALGHAMPNARLEMIREAGHSAFWERPNHFNRVLLDFLG